MKREYGRILEALDAVEAFLGENPSRLGDAISSAAHRHLAASRERMRQHVTAQEASTRDHRDSAAIKRTLRQVLLRDHIRPIAAIGRALLPEVGELRAVHVPRGRASFAALIAASYGIAEVAKKHEAALVAAGRSPEFVAQLIAATDALADAVNVARRIRARRIEATKALDAEAKVARRSLGLLDTLVRAGVKTDEGLLARWMHVRRVVSRVSPVVAQSPSPSIPSGPAPGQQVTSTPTPAPTDPRERDPGASAVATVAA